MMKEPGSGSILRNNESGYGGPKTYGSGPPHCSSLGTDLQSVSDGTGRRASDERIWELAPASGQGCSAQPAVKVRVETVETNNFLYIFPKLYGEVLIKSAIIKTIFAQQSADSDRIRFNIKVKNFRTNIF